MNIDLLAENVLVSTSFVMRMTDGWISFRFMDINLLKILWNIVEEAKPLVCVKSRGSYF